MIDCHEMKGAHRVILLIPSAREFDRGLRRGIVDYAHAHGPWIFYDEAPAYLQRLTPRQSLSNMRSWAADGMIVLQSRLAEVQSLRIPRMVAIGTRQLDESVCQIVCANEEIGRMGATTLIGLGLRHFAYCGLEGLEFSDRRGTGFNEVLAAAGHSALVYSSSARNLGQAYFEEKNMFGEKNLFGH